MERPENAQLDWNALRDEGGSVSIAFATGRPRHIAVIPEEVLDDGLRLSTGTAKQNAQDHSVEIEAAIERAFERGDWRELVRVGDGAQLHQLWITRSDFGV